jgi:methionyl-tRNA formyltransferase
MKLIICDAKGSFNISYRLLKANNIKFVRQRNDLTHDLLETFKPDYVLFTHWHWLVEDSIHQNYDCVVFHAAPLPYGRGGSPIQNLILNGYKSTPVCAIKMIDELDAGPIYSMVEVSLEGSLEEIFIRINSVINEIIFNLVSQPIEPKAQIGDVYKFNRLGDADNQIPKGISLNQIYDRVRMLDHASYPSAYIKYGDIKLEFSNAELSGSELVVKCIITKC